MMGFLLNLPGWAALAPFVLILLAGLAVVVFVPPRLWRPAFIALAALAVAALGLQVARGFYQRGKADCEADHAAAAEAQRAADQARADAADDTAAETMDTINRQERTDADRIRVIYRSRPSTCGVSADGVRLVTAGEGAGKPTLDELAALPEANSGGGAVDRGTGDPGAAGAPPGN